MRTVRSEPEGGAVLAYSEIHIPLAFGAVVRASNRSRQPIFAQIESRLRDLAALVVGNPATKRSFDELQTLVQVKTEELARTLESHFAVALIHIFDNFFCIQVISN